MSDKFISLKCPHCGGKLDIYDDMNNFACGYCGTEMATKRRGGTVSLEAITTAISKVQTGTDKTAAELAIARYERELISLNEKLLKERKGSSGIGTLAICAFLFLATLGSLLDKSSNSSQQIILILCTIVSGWFGYNTMQNKAEQIRNLTRSIEETNALLNKNMQIANK